MNRLLQIAACFCFAVAVFAAIGEVSTDAVAWIAGGLLSSELARTV